MQFFQIDIRRFTTCTSRYASIHCWRRPKPALLHPTRISTLKMSRNLHSKAHSTVGYSITSIPWSPEAKEKRTFQLVHSKDAAPEIDSPIIENLLVEIKMEGPHQLRIIIQEGHGEEQRFRIPRGLLPMRHEMDWDWETSLYNIVVDEQGIRVSRKSGPIVFQTLWNSLVFKDQYLRLTDYSLPKEPLIQGLGETVSTLVRPMGKTALWARDSACAREENLYGVHPFHMEIRSGEAHGIFLQNSNGMDVEIAPEKLTWHVLGGILDFTLLLGPNPIQVIQQYAGLVGHAALPHYTQLGFAQSRWGYQSVKDAKEVVESYQREGIPLDTIYADIDYMDGYKNFTFGLSWDKRQTQEFLSWLHQRGQSMVAIIDPAIKTEVGYHAYDVGTRMDVWIKINDSEKIPPQDSSTRDFVGKVWPGRCVFPDFLNPVTHQYWSRMIRQWLKEMPVDGIWIDMNEPANFNHGECLEPFDSPNSPFDRQLAPQVTEDESSTRYQCYAVEDLPKPDKFDHPPYRIQNGGASQCLDLEIKTLNGRAWQTNGQEWFRHYNVHNLYGHAEAITTYKALREISPGKRPMILTRSCFAGTSRFASKWLGDNHSTFESLKESISGILTYQLFNFPMIGADIGGFFGHASDELLQRWMQLGAFYPFARNHNGLDWQSQEPYLSSIVAAIARESLLVRYALLPYWYTQFYLAWVRGDPVVRALNWIWPNEESLSREDTQFMIGPGLMVAPIVEEGAIERKVTFPPGLWYSWETGSKLNLENERIIVVSNPPDASLAPLYLLGGNIIPLQTPELTDLGPVTALSCKTLSVQLIVALDQWQSAQGLMYIDDGESIGQELGSTAGIVEFTFKHGKLSCTPLHTSIPPLPISQIKVFGWGDVDCTEYGLQVNEKWELHLGD